MTSGCLEYAVVSEALEGESSGDGYVVLDPPQGTLVAVFDGLGHGPDAYAATLEARSAMQEVADRPLPAIVEHCHQRIRGTRGVAMSLARFEPGDILSWLGVGNVDAVLVRGLGSAQRGREHLLMRSGVVGYQLPPLKASSVTVVREDLLAMATDGIRPGFADQISRLEDPRTNAERVFAWGHHRRDDALLLVARYLGGGGAG